MPAPLENQQKPTPKYRIAREVTEDGMFEVTNKFLLEHTFYSLMDVPIVKYKTKGVEHEKHCLWCQDIQTGETMFIPIELLEETES